MSAKGRYIKTKRTRARRARKAYLADQGSPFGEGTYSREKARSSRAARRAQPREVIFPKFLGGYGASEATRTKRQGAAKRAAKTRTDPFGFKQMQRNFGRE